MDEKGLAEQLLFSKEAAEYLEITVQRLNKLVQEGKVEVPDGANRFDFSLKNHYHVRCTKCVCRINL